MNATVTVFSGPGTHSARPLSYARSACCTTVARLLPEEARHLARVEAGLHLELGAGEAGSSTMHFTPVPFSSSCTACEKLLTNAFVAP